jgi:D-lyxose ketol-isomerase
MNQETSISRRALCGGLVGLGAGLLAGQHALAADDSKPAKPKDKPAKKPKTPLALKNSDFYGPDGKFNEEAAKKAYLKLSAYFGYPLNENVRKNLTVTDFGLGRFTEVGLAFVAWINDQKAGYASLEVFLLPSQMIPEHWHVGLDDQKVPPKMESWVVRYGATFAYGDGEPTEKPSVKIHESQAKFVTAKHETPIRPGEVVGVGKPLEKHWQQAGPEGCILTEMSTYHTGEAVKFADPAIKF